MDSLLEQFLAQECTPPVRRMLAEAVTDSAGQHSGFEFNRFEVSIYRDRGIVVLEDVLDATDAGVQQVTLENFTAALGRCSG